jgi:hypothetical protein
VLPFIVITDDLTLSSKDQNIFCIVNCKEDYDHLNLACKPIFQKINTLCGKASIEVEGKHFDLDILMGGDCVIKAIICGVLFASGAITFYEGNNLLSALLWFFWTLFQKLFYVMHYF